MNARKQYITMLRNSRPSELCQEKTVSAIRRELMEWILLRRYDLPDDDLGVMSTRLDIPKEDFARYISVCLGTRYSSMRKRLRICDACELLVSNPDEPLSSIGRRVGITDKRNFRKEFAQEVGTYPSDWRMMHCRRPGLLTVTEPQETD